MDVAIRMPIKTYSVTVFVKDSSSKAVSSARAYLDGVRKSETDDLGKCTITEVPVGQHIVAAEKSGYVGHSTTITVTKDTTINCLLIEEVREIKPVMLVTESLGGN